MISNELIEEVQRVYGKTHYELFNDKSRDFRSLEARRAVQYFLYADCGVYNQVARMFNTGHDSVLYNIKLIDEYPVLRHRIINIRQLPTIEQQLRDLYDIINQKYIISSHDNPKMKSKLYDHSLINKSTVTAMIHHYTQISLTFVIRVLKIGAGHTATLISDNEIKEKIQNYYLLSE